MGGSSIVVSSNDDAARAVLSAIKMREEMARINELFGGADLSARNLSTAPAGQTGARADRQIFVGIGISAGEVMAGIFGSARKKEYTVFGPPVNLASRLERLAGKNQILICDETYRQVRDMVQVEKMAPLPVKGIERKFDVYSVIGRI